MPARPRGLRSMTTMRAIRSQGPASKRAQLATELARLEHERARLLKTLQAWQENAQRTTEQLAQVQARAAALQAALAASTTTAPNPTEPEPPLPWQTQRLEY
ncbi:MAG: hypothetical protein Fur005_25150 [Roseiflexaceae bacterium]